MTKYVSDQMLSHSFELHDQRMKVFFYMLNYVRTLEVIKSCGIYQWCYYNSHIEFKASFRKPNLGSQMGRYIQCKTATSNV